ncbi:MAG: type II secretion system F family protein [Candidatus Komeilibacteria bacterium]|nr:type II secretion system F family protein [Candidatus Komeilibacteria bacterium]
MTQYLYQARNERQELFQGVVEAASEDLAVEALFDKGLTVVSLKKEVEGLKLSFLKKKVTRKDVVVFARQMSVMISANLPIVPALRIISQQLEKPVFKEIITEVADEVEGGSKLSQALSKHTQAFSNFFISMIKSGETSGKLDEVLQYLANQEEKDYDLVSKIKGAMIYPTVIISGMVILGTAMMIFVIPKLTEMLLSAGVKLPFTTRLLIFTSNMFRDYWWLIIIVVGIIIFVVRTSIKKGVGAIAWDAAKMKLPIFGILFQKIYIVRFSRSLATLVMGGLPLTAALKIVSEIVGNRAYRDLIDQTVKEVEDGNSIAVIFSGSKLFPKLVSQMLAVGEKTGRIDEILGKIADFYQREIENMVANMTSLIEPVIMIVIGVAVGVMVSAIMLPMYQLANQF